jgi:integrase
VVWRPREDCSGREEHRTAVGKVFAAPGVCASGAAAPGDPTRANYVLGGVHRHGLFMRRAFKPTIKGDKKRKIKPALPAELHALRFHDLRHTCASLLIAQGAHPKIIQERLGHASITTTMNRYSHLFEGLDATLIDGLDTAHDDAANPPDNITMMKRAAP